MEAQQREEGFELGEGERRRRKRRRRRRRDKDEDERERESDEEEKNEKKALSTFFDLNRFFFLRLQRG